MAKKEYRRFIRIGGKVKRSPKGLSKTQADIWYNRLYEQRETMKGGFYIPTTNGPTLDDYFSETWLPRRKKKKIKSTWSSDIQRYNDYVKPQLGRSKLNISNFFSQHKQYIKQNANFVQIFVRKNADNIFENFGGSNGTKTHVI